MSVGEWRVANGDREYDWRESGYTIHVSKKPRAPDTPNFGVGAKSATETYRPPTLTWCELRTDRLPVLWSLSAEARLGRA